MQFKLQVNSLSEKKIVSQLHKVQIKVFSMASNTQKSYKNE